MGFIEGHIQILHHLKIVQNRFNPFDSVSLATPRFEIS